jgi:hypothetical protein
MQLLLAEDLTPSIVCTVALVKQSRRCYGSVSAQNYKKVLWRRLMVTCVVSSNAFAQLVALA